MTFRSFAPLILKIFMKIKNKNAKFSHLGRVLKGSVIPIETKPSLRSTSQIILMTRSYGTGPVLLANQEEGRGYLHTYHVCFCPPTTFFMHIFLIDFTTKDQIYNWPKSSKIPILTRPKMWSMWIFYRAALLLVNLQPLFEDIFLFWLSCTKSRLDKIGNILYWKLQN